MPDLAELAAEYEQMTPRERAYFCGEAGCLHHLVHVRGGRIFWLCSRCGQLIHDHEGGIWIDARLAHRLSGLDESAWPVEPPSWSITHYRCGGYREVDVPYTIPVEEARTVEQVADWTRHLSEKVWYAATDWSRVVEAVDAGIAA